MNDASHPALDHSRNASEAGPRSENDVSRSPASAGRCSTSSAAEQKYRAQKEQKLKFLDSLIRNIDIMIYCQLSILYYMDVSLFHFLLRGLPQWFYFTPKPDAIIPIPPGQHPYIGTIFGTNLFCMLLHLVFSPPSAGEATRGYLHEGWMIDFVGQASPVGKWRLLGLDCLCLGLQIVMLCMTLEKNKEKSLGVERTVLDTSRRVQDHDAEEAGMLVSDPAIVQDIELQPLRATSADRAGNHEGTEDDDTFHQDEERGDAHPLDSFYTGEHVIANLHILDTIRTQWRSRSAGVHSANPTTASGVQSAAALAGRRLTLNFGALGRREGEG